MIVEKSIRVILACSLSSQIPTYLLPKSRRAESTFKFTLRIQIVPQYKFNDSNIACTSKKLHRILLTSQWTELTLCSDGQIDFQLC